MEKIESFQATEEIISDGEIQGKRNLISAEFFLNAKQRKAFFVLKISINFCRDVFFFRNKLLPIIVSSYNSIQILPVYLVIISQRSFYLLLLFFANI